MRQLREEAAKFKKYPGTQLCGAASVCNDGFPGNFNLSFTEAEMLREYGQYIDCDHDYIYSKIQPVIRFNDFLGHIMTQDKESYRYSGVFDMADIGGSISLKDSGRSEELASFSIRSLYDFLVNHIGLKRENFRISYCAGGSVSDITGGKYTFDYQIPEDKSIAHWKECGIKEEQFVADGTRDTFLSLNIYGLPTPWGYRQEVNYIHDGKMLDIATVEYLVYEPIFEEEKIVNLAPWKHSWSIAVVGMERLLMVLEDREKISDISTIKPIKDKLRDSYGISEEADLVLAAESIRVIHRVFSDAASYRDLSVKRRKKLRTYSKALINVFKKNNLERNMVRLLPLFELNFKIQDYYSEFRSSAQNAAQEVIEGEKRFMADRSKRVELRGK